MTRCKNLNIGCTKPIKVKDYKDHVRYYCIFHRNYCPSCYEIITNHVCPMLISYPQSQFNDFKQELFRQKDENALVTALREIRFQNQKLKDHLEKVSKKMMNFISDFQICKDSPVD